MGPIQSNTQEGVIQIITGTTSLLGLDGTLCKIKNNAGVPSAFPPATANDITPFVVEDGNVVGQSSGLRPLNPNRNVRIIADGSGSAGDVMVASANNLGQVHALPAHGGGTAMGVGVAEENYVVGQYVLIRPQVHLTPLTISA